MSNLTTDELKMLEKKFSDDLKNIFHAVLTAAGYSHVQDNHGGWYFEKKNVSPKGTLNGYDRFTLTCKGKGVIYVKYQRRNENMFDGNTHITILFGDDEKKYALFSQTPYIHFKQVNGRARIDDDNKVIAVKSTTDNTFYGYYNARGGRFEGDVIGKDLSNYKTKDIVSNIRNASNPTPKIILVRSFDDFMTKLAQEGL